MKRFGCFEALRRPGTLPDSLNELRKEVMDLYTELCRKKPHYPVPEVMTRGRKAEAFQQISPTGGVPCLFSITFWASGAAGAWALE